MSRPNEWCSVPSIEQLFAHSGGGGPTPAAAFFFFFSISPCSALPSATAAARSRAQRTLKRLASFASSSPLTPKLPPISPLLSSLSCPQERHSRVQDSLPTQAWTKHLRCRVCSLCLSRACLGKIKTFFAPFCLMSQR